MNYKHLLLFISIALFFNSCSEETDCCPMPETKAEFDSGVFVLNEGNFGSSNASVSYINEDSEEIQSQIFNNINGFGLGDTAQSIEMHENIAIIVMNVSNKMEIVDRYTFQHLGTIDTNLQNPRYAEVLDNRIYVTNWGNGSNPNDDFVAVFDISDFSFNQEIAVAEGPEKIVASNSKLYVAHKGGYSFSNIISVIDSSTNSTEAEIEVGYVPNSIQIKGSDLWVLSSGKPAYSETETSGELSRIDLVSNEVIDSFEFSENTIHPENLQISDNTAYFTVGKSVFKYTPGDPLPVVPEYNLDDAKVLYGFEIHDRKIYVASPNADFTGDGILYIYDLNNGDLLDQYATGINPNGIYFN